MYVCKNDYIIQIRLSKIKSTSNQSNDDWFAHTMINKVTMTTHSTYVMANKPKKTFIENMHDKLKKCINY